MSISLKTHKKLWGQAANRCAFENCRRELFVDTFATDDSFTIGDEAHIISEKTNGPRYQEEFPSERIDKYENLILLCKIHHTTIDNDENYYTIKRVLEIKKNHEKWVNETLGVDLEKLKGDELFADYIDKIQFLADFDNWIEWSAKLLGGHHTGITKRQFDNLVELHKYLRGRVYPNHRSELLKGIIQFNTVLEDFINEFDLFNDNGETDKNYYITEQLYRKNLITGEKQEFHEYTLEELIFELTRAGNYLCDQIRKTIFPGFRTKEGVLLLKEDPISGTAFRRLEYKKNEKYPGINKIKLRLKKRFRMEN